MAVIADERGNANGQIFNIGNPDNECSVRVLAEKLAHLYEARKAEIPGYTPPRIEEVNSATYYGKGYQDILTRKPKVAKAKQLLGWQPKVGLDEALELTFDAFLKDWLEVGARAKGLGFRDNPMPSSLPGAAGSSRAPSPEPRAPILGLRIDVDTHDGMKAGVPVLLDLFREAGVRARSTSRWAPTTPARRSSTSCAVRGSSARCGAPVPPASTASARCSPEPCSPRG